MPSSLAAPIAGAREAEAKSVRAGLGGRFLILVARIALGATTMVLSINLWTGFPILALWVGSRCAGGDALSMGGIAIALLALVALMALGVKALTRLSLIYDRLTGRPPAVRQPAPWLLSMSSKKVQPTRERRDLNAIETIVIAVVIAAFVLFEIWFFFLASPVLPGGG